MDATDRFGPLPSDDAGKSAAHAGSEPFDTHEAHDAPAADDNLTAGEDARRHRRPKGRTVEDPVAWARRLEQLGFTPAEVSRLIFERLRPRQEGLVRT